MLRRATALLMLVSILHGTQRAQAEDDPAAAPRLAAQTRIASTHLEAGRSQQAVLLLEQILERVPKSPAARKNLGLALSREAGRLLARKDATRALTLLDRAVDLHPGRLAYETQRVQALRLVGRLGEALRAAEALVERSPLYGDAWLALADVHERIGELPQAIEALTRLAALRPAMPTLGSRLETLRTRAQAEALFLTHGSGNFHVRYPQDADAGTVRLALTILEDAYAHVTADLGFAPRTPAQVVLYAGGEFERVTGAHSWVGALYNNGVLRVPTRNLERHRATAERVLTHEFTHHVLRERSPSLPIWWHEGIAQFVEQRGEAARRRQREMGELLAHQKQASRLLTLDELRRLRISTVRDHGTVTLFYGQALHFTGWLVERFGSGALPAFLTALETTADPDAAARRAFGADVGALFALWIASL